MRQINEIRTEKNLQKRERVTESIKPFVNQKKQESLIEIVRRQRDLERLGTRRKIVLTTTAIEKTIYRSPKSLRCCRYPRKTLTNTDMRMMFQKHGHNSNRTISYWKEKPTIE